MKVAVVSDIHGNLPALQAVAGEIDAEGVDFVLNLGDIVSGPLWPRETADWLMARAWPAIAGNHERQALAAVPGAGVGDHDDDSFAAAEITAAQRNWLRSLPPQMDAAGGRIHGFHASPGHDLRPLLETVMPSLGLHGCPGIRAATDDEVRRRLGAALPPAAELLLCGHTHVPRVRWLDGRLIVNPGSVGRPAYEDAQPHPYVVQMGAPHARWALLVARGAGAGASTCASPSDWQVQLRATAYDWQASAQRAASLGFADWARQLRTGLA